MFASTSSAPSSPDFVYIPIINMRLRGEIIMLYQKSQITIWLLTEWHCNAQYYASRQPENSLLLYANNTQQSVPGVESRRGCLAFYVCVPLHSKLFFPSASLNIFIPFFSYYRKRNVSFWLEIENQDVYLAAAVLIAIRLRPDIHWEVTEQNIDDSWAYAIEILRDYQSDSRAARRCVVALEFLHEKLPNISEQGQPQQHQQQRNWKGDPVDLGALFRLDQGYQNLDGAAGSWNWQYKQAGLEDFTFLDPFNVL